MKLFAAFNSDAYKIAHADMYAEGTESVYSNLTPRSDRIYRGTATRYYDGNLVFVGCQGALMEIFENWNEFFNMEKGIALAQYKFYCDNLLGPDAVGVEHLSKLHDLGYLPLRVKTLTEGTKVPMGVPVMTITNTVYHAFWLVNFLETTISNLTWKPSTVATIAAEYKRMMLDYAEKTGCNPESVLFQGHSFACRGMSGPEDSARSEFGHIASFLGTDSLGSIIYAQNMYKADPFVAASVPATEHAVATSNILRIERELFHSGDADIYKFAGVEQQGIFHRMVDAGEDQRLIAEVMFLYELMKKFPKGILSYVADSFDFWALISRGLPYMKEVIMRRESNGITPGRLVIRPDSARVSPVEVVCGMKVVPEGASIGEFGEYDVIEQDSKYYTFDIHTDVYDGYPESYTLDQEIPVEEVKGAVRILGEIFGHTLTPTGHMLMDDHIGLIYGDSITPKRCLAILEGLAENGYASGNCVFGIGSYTYQCVTRDTFGFAVKATNTVVNGERIAIFKDPKTDAKKKSAKGLLNVTKDVDGKYVLNDNVSVLGETSGELILRFENGVFYNLTNLGEIRERLVQG